jgi:hypothetical protein
VRFERLFLECEGRDQPFAVWGDEDRICFHAVVEKPKGHKEGGCYGDAEENALAVGPVCLNRERDCRSAPTPSR